MDLTKRRSPTGKGRFTATLKRIQGYKFDPHLLWSFDWPLLLLIVAIAVFGIISIFAATAVPVEHAAKSFLELLQTQPTYYARLQIFWLLAGLVALGVMVVIDYDVFGKWSNALYWANILLLTVVLFMERGRGNMAGWFRWGSDAARTMQPAEFGKLAIIVSMAKLFSSRSKPITRVAELLPVLAYIGLPLILIGAQPDFGTAMVYVVIFAVMLFASGTSPKLLIGMLCLTVLMLVPLWFYMSTADSSFRMNRILVFLDQTADLQGDGMQMYNAKLAVGSGGLWGKGMFSAGSIASLNYIPDDYTDFIFAIVCETFGFVGAAALVAAYLALLIRLVMMSNQAADAFGTYIVIGVMAMMLFHIVENIGMVIGLLPVTGIPLPFVSYGGSNFLTNMMGMGLAMNVAMRSKDKRKRPPKPIVAQL